MNKKVDLHKLDDCEWDSPELFPESHCHNDATHHDKVSGFVFCAAHAASFETLMSNTSDESVAMLEAQWHARRASEPSVPVAPESVEAEHDRNERTGSQDVPGAGTSSVPDVLTV
jgi:hypothetical protein